MSLEEILPPKFNWTIEPSPNPDRYWVTCRCPHGTVTGLAMVPPVERPADIGPIIETVAENLHRQTDCQCEGLVPPLEPGSPQLLPAWTPAAHARG